MLGTACGGGGGVQPNNPPVADFTAGACVEGAACSFTDKSTDDGTIASWLWGFGDANAPVADNASTLKDPTHTFSVAGDYQVSLKVTDDASESSTKTATVTVAQAGAGNVLPTADFTPNCSGLVCSFTDASSDSDGSISAWSWTFGDGGTENNRNPNHEYLAAGTYDVALEVTDNSGGKGSLTKQVTVTLSQGSAPTAEFFPACTGFTCTFIDQSTDADGTIASRSWNFGDGTPLSTETSPSHTFAAAGHYNVALTVTDNGGGTGSKNETVTIANPVTATLTLAVRSRLSFTLSERGCTSPRNAFMITAPVADTLFKDGCRVPDATQLPFTFPTRGPFAAGDVTVQFVSGSTHQMITPSVKVTGNATDGWTLTFDDGEDAPADMDLVVTVRATAAP